MLLALKSANASVRAACSTCLPKPAPMSARAVDAPLLERERSLGKQLKTSAQLLNAGQETRTGAWLEKGISQLETDTSGAGHIRKDSPALRALNANRSRSS